jgi:hypothetical protein
VQKAETHLHTAGGSGCAVAGAAEIARVYKARGYKIITVTNHFSQFVFEDYFPVGSRKEKIDRYAGLFYELRGACAAEGITVLLGAELALALEGDRQEYLLYGISEAFLYDNPTLYRLPQRDVFGIVSEAGALMYQAHPFRPYCTRGNPEFMHGVEVFNAHPGHDNSNGCALEFAAANGLLKIGGSDFHDVFPPGAKMSGVFVPDGVSDGAEFAQYLRYGKPKIIGAGKARR